MSHLDATDLVKPCTMPPYPATRPSSPAGTRRARRGALPLLLALLLAPLVSAQPFAYVTHATSNSVSVVDLATGGVTGTFTTGSLPTGAAISADGAWLLVAESGADRLLAIDLGSGTATGVPVGSAPSGVATDPSLGRAYVANTQDDTVSVVDLPSLAVIATVTVGDAPLALAADGARVWVANFGDDTVSVIDAATLAVTATVPVGGMPSGIAALPGGGRAWVANLFDDTVSVIDAGAGPGVTATIGVAASPRGVAVSPAGDRVWVAGFAAGAVTVLDATTGAVLDTVDVALNAADVRVTPAGDRVLVTDPAAAEMVVLDAATAQPLAPATVGVGHLVVGGFTLAAASIPDIPTLDGLGLAALLALMIASALVLLRLRRARGGLATVALLLAGSLLAVVGPTSRAEAQPAFTLTDGTWNDADWEIVTPPPTSGNVSAIQVPAGGDPGPYRYMNHQHLQELVFPLEVVHRYVGPGSTYDPSTLGAITSIDASWDRRNGSEGFPQVEEAFVVVQDGTAYRTALDTFASTSWELTVHNGLTAADFDDGSGNAPDFSAAGSPLTFGYLRRTVADVGFGEHHIDELSVTVHADGSVTPPTGPGTLRFEQRSYTAVSGEVFAIRVLRQGGSDGAVGATVQVPFLVGTSSFPVSWADGDATPKTVSLDLTSLPPDGPIVTLKPILTTPTGGAALDSRFDRALVLVVPADSGPLGALVLFLRLLFSAAGPAWLLLPLLAGGGAGWRWLRRGRPYRGAGAGSGGRRNSSGAAASSPAEAP